jgi:hypothetical protein
MNSLITRISVLHQGQTYRGILVGSTETTLTIQLVNGNRKTISRNDMTDLDVSVEDLGYFKFCLKCGDFVLDGNPNHECEELWV